ncbi:deoxycytidylate deaminase [Anabaena phage Elbi]|nr:deoxycytidylate deaminase [Anabaena phage Elbi]
MIEPYERSLVRFITDEDLKQSKVISYGLSSFGYDIRLSSKEFFTFRRVPGMIVDPKKFSLLNLTPGELYHDETGSFFVIPANSYGLGVAVERLNMPRDITAICVGKSTYARCGIIANITPAEAGWKGHLTLEFSNSSSADCRIYVNEGVVQLLFLAGEHCQTSYSDRNGKYQNQSQSVVLPRL